jgi:xyloglucan-specific exo-beta-1,4-glucanase
MAEGAWLAFLASLFGALSISLAPSMAGAAEPPAVSYDWRNVVIGGGGYSPNIIFSPVEKGLAYLRTDVGGAFRWDARQQGWIPIEDDIWNDSYYGIESIAPDPKDPNTVYLAAGMYAWAPAAIMRSNDRGAHWDIIPVPFKMGGNEDGRGMGERLAVDPERTSTLFFGSRHDGLWRSDDRGKTWRKVESFPWRGLGTPGPQHTHGGISFVVFGGSGVIYVGVADPAPNHLFRSTDGGESWTAVSGGPGPQMLPTKAAMGPYGVLYVDYATGIGPNGADKGAVWKLDTRTGGWTDITPARGEDAEGGYMGLSLDRQRDGRIAVSTVDRWNHKDTVWLSNDGGAHWTSLREHSKRDESAVPWLNYDHGQFGGWISGLAFDPFDGGTLAYTTGATVYRTNDALKPELLWKPWVKGVEETVPMDLISPSAGAHLISGIGDVHGFVHDSLDRQPAKWLLDPDLPHTLNLDWAGRVPNIIVRNASGYFPDPKGASLGWSADGGRSWHELIAPPVQVGTAAPARIDTDGKALITVSADGKTFVISGAELLATADRGRNWWRPRGVPAGLTALADKADARVSYAVDYAGGRLFVSRDGARSFRRAAAIGLPTDISGRTGPFPTVIHPRTAAVPGTAGEIWLLTNGHFYRSTDYARSFTPMVQANPMLRDMSFLEFGFGKAAPGARAPAIYAFGVHFNPNFGGLYRSTDGGATWARINDDAHQWGLRYRVVTGDPRIFGRVYVATDGRGIFFGDPSSP